MQKERIQVVGLTHVDLGWKKGRDEMAAIFDTFLLRLLDILDRHPDFHYLLEQALHYCDLKVRRPDLFEKVKKYVAAGNLEFATGVASTIELNVTNGESFVRNMQLGLAWLKREIGVAVETCMMIDTFGFPPQMPQVLNQFGFNHLFANRFGGGKINDVFLCEGLDGSSILVAGRDCQCRHIKDEHFLFQIYFSRSQIDELFKKAESITNQPLILIPYSENEVVPEIYILELMKCKEDRYCFGSLKEFMDKLLQEKENWPWESADLNPEFTGTFSLRQKLRLINRETEQALLDAEKLCAFTREHQYDEILENGWWEMAYTQFHDILTGSHPTAVYLDCLKRYEKVRGDAEAIMEKIFLSMGCVEQHEDRGVYTIWNSLPWERTEEVVVELAAGWQGVDTVMQKGTSIPFYVLEGKLHFNITIAPMSSTV